MWIYRTRTAIVPIYLIKGDKAETICEFRGRLIYDVDYAVKKSKE